HLAGGGCRRQLGQFGGQPALLPRQFLALTLLLGGEGGAAEQGQQPGLHGAQRCAQGQQAGAVGGALGGEVVEQAAGQGSVGAAEGGARPTPSGQCQRQQGMRWGFLARGNGAVEGGGGELKASGLLGGQGGLQQPHRFGHPAHLPQADGHLVVALGGVGVVGPQRLLLDVQGLLGQRQ